MSFGWMSSIETQIIPDETSPDSCSHSFCVERHELSMIATCLIFGSLISGVMAGPVMAKFGRKRAMLTCLAFICCGWILLLLANKWWMMGIARFVMGLGYGGGLAIGPVYIGECSQPSIRGFLTGFLEVNDCIGILVGYIFGYLFLSFTQCLINIFVTVIVCISLLLLPESPAYEVSKGHIDGARKSLTWLREKNYKVEEEITEIIEFQKSQEDIGFKAFIKEKVNQRALVIGVGLFVGYEFSGQSAILLYTSRIFLNAEIRIDPNLAAIFVGLFTALGIFISVPLVDRVGRRILLLISYTSMAISFFLLALQSFLISEETIQSSKWSYFPVVMLCFYMFSNSIGCSPVSFVVLGEIFSQNVKEISATFCVACQSTSALIVVILFPFLDSNFGSVGVFLVFSIFNLLFSIFVYIFVIETKGKSFMEIQSALLKSSNKN